MQGKEPVQAEGKVDFLAIQRKTGEAWVRKEYESSYQLEGKP